MEEKTKSWANRLQEGIEEDSIDEKVIGADVTLIVKDKKARLPDYVMLFQWFSSYAAKNYKPSTCKVLFFLMSISEYENYLSLDVSAIVDHVMMSRRSVQEALKQLKETNVISVVEHPSDRRRNDYFLNPFGSWKGSSNRRERYIKRAKQQQIQFDFPNIMTSTTTTTTTLLT